MLRKVKRIVLCRSFNLQIEDVCTTWTAKRISMWSVTRVGRSDSVLFGPPFIPKGGGKKGALNRGAQRVAQ